MKNIISEIEQHFKGIILPSIYSGNGEISDDIFSDSEKQDILDMQKDGMTKSEIINQIHNWGIIPIQKGELYEDTFYRPMICLKNDDGDLTGKSLVDGIEYCDNEQYCDSITKEEADILINKWKSGEKEVLLYKGWSKSDADEFIKNWRK